MKYMHQYKQKRWKYFAFVAKINFFLLYLNHCPDSAIQKCITLQTHTRFADPWVKLAQCVGILYWKAGKAWRARVQDSAWMLIFGIFLVLQLAVIGLIGGFGNSRVHFTFVKMPTMFIKTTRRILVALTTVGLTGCLVNILEFAELVIRVDCKKTIHRITGGNHRDILSALVQLFLLCFNRLRHNSYFIFSAENSRCAFDVDRWYRVFAHLQARHSSGQKYNFGIILTIPKQETIHFLLTKVIFNLTWIVWFSL